MYIKYDESELFEFFECEPVPVGDDDAGDLIFTYSDNEFKLILFLSTYEMYWLYISEIRYFTAVRSSRGRATK